MERELLKAARRKQAKDELIAMRDSIRDSIAFAQATGKPIPEGLQRKDEALTFAIDRFENQIF